MREKLYIFLTLLFFLSGSISPVLSVSGKVGEVSDEGERITSLGTVSYGGQSYTLYRLGDVYIVLDPSSKFVRDQTTIQRIIFTKELSERGSRYATVYGGVNKDLEALEGAIKDIRSALVVGGAITAFTVFTPGTLFTVAVGGNAISLSKTEVVTLVASVLSTSVDYSGEKALGTSLSNLCSGFGSEPSYEDVKRVSEGSQELLANMSEIRSVIALEKGNNTFAYVGDVLVELGNRFKGIPIIGRKLGNPLIEKGDMYKLTISEFDSDLAEIEAMSEEIATLSTEAVTLAPESLQRISAKEEEANSNYRETSSFFLDLKGYVSDLSLRKLSVASQATLVASIEKRIHATQEMINEEEYNSAIGEIAELDLQIREVRRSAEEVEEKAKSEAKTRLEELEEKIFQVQERADSAIEAGVELPNLDYQMATVKGDLDASKAKFREGYFLDAADLTKGAMEELSAIDSAIDSAISERQEVVATLSPSEAEEAGITKKLYFFFSNIKNKLLSIF